MFSINFPDTFSESTVVKKSTKLAMYGPMVMIGYNK